MFKDKIIVILMGLTLGLFGAFAIFLFQNYFSAPSKPTTLTTPIAENSSSVTATPEIKTKGTDFLSITSPEDDTLTQSTTTTLSGKTNPLRQLIVSGNLEDQLISSSNEGVFNATVKLEDGANEISVIPLDNKDTDLIQTIRITKTIQ